MKRFFLAALMGLLIGNLAFAASTDVKSQIGVQDLKLDDDGTAHGTFTRRTSTGGLLTLDKIDGNQIPWSLDYSRTIRPGDIIAKGPWVDVRAFGAVGDGVTDDTAAIQLAIDNASGYSIVFFPSGTYKVTSTINIANNVKPVSLMGAVNIAGYGGFQDTSNWAYGANINYTGSGTLFNFDSVRGTFISYLTLKGPGRTVTGTKGITFSGSSGVYIKNCIIRMFETGIEFGTLYDANADMNYFEGNRIQDVDYGVNFIRSQHYMNTFINNHIVYGRYGVKAHYSFQINWYGGSVFHGGSLFYDIGNGLYYDTVASKSGQDITLTNGTGLVAGMYMIIKNNSYKIGDFRHPYSTPLHTISSVDNTTATITGSVQAEVAAGDNVLYGYIPISFKITNGIIEGVHFETGATTTNIFLYQSTYGSLSVDVRNCNFDYAFAGNYETLYNKIVPFIVTDGSGWGTTQQTKLRFHNNMVNHNFPKMMLSGGEIFDSNNWTSRPIVGTFSNGYPANTTKFINEQYNGHWGKPDAGLLLKQMDWASYYYAPTNTEEASRRFGFNHNNDVPVYAFNGEPIFQLENPETGVTTSKFLAYKNLGGIYGEYNSSAITTTFNGTAGNYWFTVPGVVSKADIWQGRVVTITGAGSGGTNITRQILFIDASDNTVYVNTNIATSVTNAVVSAPALNLKKFGRQTDFGTVAPTTGTWTVGDITWNTAAALPGTIADTPIYWYCSVAGTPGTWVAVYPRFSVAPASATALGKPGMVAVDNAYIYWNHPATDNTWRRAAGASW